MSSRARILIRCSAAIAACCAIASWGAEGDGRELMYEHRGADDTATIVLIHDWFGDSPYYRAFGERLAALGYGVLAVDLYGGRPGAQDHAGAWQLMKTLQTEQVARSIDAAVSAAAQRSGFVVTIGFSLGAPFALQAAARNPSLVDAAVIFYGDALDDPAELARLAGPVLAIYGAKDSTYGEVHAVDAAARFARLAEDAGAAVELHVYPGAHHAFAQPLFNGGETYDADAAEAAWSVAADFIARIERRAAERRAPRP